MLLQKRHQPQCHQQQAAAAGKEMQTACSFGRPAAVWIKHCRQESAALHSTGAAAAAHGLPVAAVVVVAAAAHLVTAAAAAQLQPGKKEFPAQHATHLLLLPADQGQPAGHLQHEPAAAAAAVLLLTVLVGRTLREQRDSPPSCTDSWPTARDLTPPLQHLRCQHSHLGGMPSCHRCQHHHRLPLLLQAMAVVVVVTTAAVPPLHLLHPVLPLPLAPSCYPSDSGPSWVVVRAHPGCPGCAGCLCRSQQCAAT